MAIQRSPSGACSSRVLSREAWRRSACWPTFWRLKRATKGVVEDFLRDELNYVVVKSWDAADEGLRLLRSDVDGRATFLVHPEDSQAKFSFIVDEAGRPPAPDHSIIPLKNTIRVLDGFGKSLEVILPKLRDGYIVPDPTAARNFALSNPDAFFLSQTGECFHNVTVTGGKQRSEGPLSMKRELREVQRILEDLEQQLRHEETRVLTLGHEIRDSQFPARPPGRRQTGSRQADDDVRATCCSNSTARCSGPANGCRRLSSNCIA